VAEIVEEISSSEYAIHHRLSRFKWMPTRCGGEMMLWKVWHPRDGVIYNELHEIKRGRYGPRRDIPPDAKANGDGDKPMIQLALTGLRV